MQEMSSTLRLGRSPEEGHGNPLQYSCLENLMDRGAWQVTVQGVTELDTTEATFSTHAQSTACLRWEICGDHSEEKDERLSCSFHSSLGNDQ